MYISRTGESFEVVYPLVYDHFRKHETWPACDDDAFSEDDDEVSRQAKQAITPGRHRGSCT
eukprot:9191076-Prorocentrum_lima.AAC.1